MEKRPFREVVLFWGYRLLVICIPALISAYFSYRSARVEADAKSASVKAKAEAGYDTLVQAVEKLQNDTESLKLEVAKQEVRIQYCEDRHPVSSARLKNQAVAAAVASSVSMVPPLKYVAPNYEKADLPDSLDEAEVLQKKLPQLSSHPFPVKK